MFFFLNAHTHAFTYTHEENTLSDVEKELQKFRGRRSNRGMDE